MSGFNLVGGRLTRIFEAELHLYSLLLVASLKLHMAFSNEDMMQNLSSGWYPSRRWVWCAVPRFEYIASGLWIAILNDATSSQVQCIDYVYVVSPRCELHTFYIRSTCTSSGDVIARGFSFRIALSARILEDRICPLFKVPNRLQERCVAQDWKQSKDISKSNAAWLKIAPNAQVLLTFVQPQKYAHIVLNYL